MAFLIWVELFIVTDDNELPEAGAMDHDNMHSEPTQERRPLVQHNMHSKSTERKKAARRTGICKSTNIEWGVVCDDEGAPIVAPCH